MVPQDDAVVPNPVADTPVETPAKTFEEDTDAVVSRTHSDFLLTSIGAKVAAVPFMWAFNIFAGAGLIFAVNTYNMDDKKTALTQVSDICLSVGFVIAMLGTSFALGRVTAAGGQLELPAPANCGAGHGISVKACEGRVAPIPVQPYSHH
jgi:hypothetical protein